jgi:DNA (cytosine-5)-methyltransferase 1
MVFHEVCSDLENIGYEVQSFIIPASGINAPHQRERLWIVAHSDNTRTNNGMQSNGECKENDKQRRGQSQSEHWENGINGITPDSDNGSGSCDTVQTRREEFKELYDSQQDAPNTKMHGFHECNGNNEINASERGVNALNDIDQSNGIGNIADTNGIGLWGKGDRIRESKFNGKNYARNNWENFPTQSPVCSGDDGISHGLDNITFSKWRNESIKGYGNAVVPQVVYRIFKTIEYIQNLKQND